MERVFILQVIVVVGLLTAPACSKAETPTSIASSLTGRSNIVWLPLLFRVPPLGGDSIVSSPPKGGTLNGEEPQHFLESSEGG